MEEHIVTLGERLSKRPLLSVVKDTITDLHQAKEAGRICTGKVVAAKELRDEKLGVIVCASVLYKECVSVLIPIPLFIDERIYPKGGLDKAKKDNRLILMRQGSEVDFLVEEVFEETEEPLKSVILGNRLAAMERVRKEDFLPDKGGQAYIKEGDIVEARITFVSEKKMGVEVRGYETIMNTHEITYDYYATLLDGYEPGDVISLRVLKAQIKDGDLRALELTGKDIGIDNRDIALANLTVGMIIPCEVTGITKTLIFVRCIFAPWTICCKPPKHFEMPMRFERVQVKVDKIDPVKKRIYGLIISAHGIR